MKRTQITTWLAAGMLAMPLAIANAQMEAEETEILLIAPVEVQSPPAATGDAASSGLEDGLMRNGSDAPQPQQRQLSGVVVDCRTLFTQGPDAARSATPRGGDQGSMVLLTDSGEAYLILPADAASSGVMGYPRIDGGDASTMDRPTRNGASSGTTGMNEPSAATSSSRSSSTDTPRTASPTEPEGEGGTNYAGDDPGPSEAISESGMETPTNNTSTPSGMSETATSTTGSARAGDPMSGEPRPTGSQSPLTASDLELGNRYQLTARVYKAQGLQAIVIQSGQQQQAGTTTKPADSGESM